MTSSEQLKKLYFSEYGKLKKLREYTDGILAVPMEGSIHAHRSGKYKHYSYVYRDENGILREINVKKKDLADYKAYIEVQCAKKVKPVVNSLISSLEGDMTSYDDKALARVYDELCELYGENVPKAFFSNRMLMEKWQNSAYVKLNYKEEKLVFKTLHGEKVRSKVEAMVADILYRMNIPYRYDARLSKDGLTFWPDFTLISPENGDVFYLEVFGMMTDRKYATDNLRKINEYHKAGFIQGDKLIIVFDAEDAEFDSETFEKTVRTLVLKES
ncbi:MAG: hypothetical protein MJ059_07470 [Lachnospiraceae bacterium]|nr:hypothetical protein [Lachnospiraceae bacterium]